MKQGTKCGRPAERVGADDDVFCPLLVGAARRLAAGPQRLMPRLALLLDRFPWPFSDSPSVPRPRLRRLTQLYAGLALSIVHDRPEGLCRTCASTQLCQRFVGFVRQPALKVTASLLATRMFSHIAFRPMC